MKPRALLRLYYTVYAVAQAQVECSAAFLARERYLSGKPGHGI